VMEETKSIMLLVSQTHFFEFIFTAI